MLKKTCLLWTVAVLLSAAPGWADGDLYVVAGGGRAVGTAINNAGQTISASGFYYLTGNINSSAAGNAITIAANDVTLDLMGFTIIGPGGIDGDGVHINDGMNRIEVRNGTIKLFNNGNGVYSSNLSNGKSHRLANLKISRCNVGIYGSADGIIVTGCECNDNITGIQSVAYGFVIDKNTCSHNTNYGFNLSYDGIITNNAATYNGTGFNLGGISGQLVDRNSSSHNTTTNWSGLTGCTTGTNTP